MTCDKCTDNRFELISKYKNKLLESTNIESNEDEMKVIDNILFRFWQMGWLDMLEKQIFKEAIAITQDDDNIYKQYICPACERHLTYGNPRPYEKPHHCRRCGQAIDWSDNE